MSRLSKSMESAAKTLHAALKLLSKNDKHLTFGEICEKLGESLEFSDWENEIMKSGYKRWRALLSFYSIDAKKAGYIHKKSGEWFITEEGVKAIKEMTPEELVIDVSKKYQQWQNNENKQMTSEKNIEQVQEANLEQISQDARDSIKDHLYRKNPYEFQDIVAALLRSMGYYTNFIADKGKDGGVDIIAYQDPLGIKVPKMKVQVKHYTSGNKITVKDIRSLVGLLHKDNEVGLFVTSGQYSPDAERFARESHIHIELIDFEKFVELWTEFYNKMTDEDKIMLPIQPIYFLGAVE